MDNSRLDHGYYPREPGRFRRIRSERGWGVANCSCTKIFIVVAASYSSLLTWSWAGSQGATDLSTAFAAAKQFGTSFSLFISFDMVHSFSSLPSLWSFMSFLSHLCLASQTVFPCNSSSDASILIALSKLYATHPNQATYKTTGRPIFSTFGGSDCTFGQSGAWADAWDSQVLKPLASQSGKDPFFIPAMYEVRVCSYTFEAVDAGLMFRGDGKGLSTQLQRDVGAGWRVRLARR